LVRILVVFNDAIPAVHHPLGASLGSNLVQDCALGSNLGRFQ